MAVRRTSKGRSRPKQATEPAEISDGVIANGDSQNASSVKNGGSPTFEQIQRRAYELFVARGGAHGGDLADWLAAEHELTANSATDH